MKRLMILLLTLSMLGGCQENETIRPSGNQGVGCHTALNDKEERVLLRCATHAQYMAGSNEASGGFADWGLYTQHKWEKCSDCN